MKICVNLWPDIYNRTMYKGIYIALSGATIKQNHMDILAQNIANANTAGFKKERIAFKDYPMPAHNKTVFRPDGRTMSEISNTMIDYSNGGIVKTGNPLDLAINGDGFFALEENRYTRGGNFKVSSDGYLATQDDIKVMGSGGPIPIQGGKIDVGSSGEVFVDGVSVGTVKMVDFPDKRVLKKLNGGIFATDETGEKPKSQIKQGYLEISNVEVVREMVQLITTLRDFESYQKMIRAFDEAASKVANEMGKR